MHQYTYVVVIIVSDLKEDLLYYLAAELNSVQAMRHVVHCEMQHIVY